MINKKLLLWDADYMAFKHKKESTLQEAIENIEFHIKEVLEFSGCDYFAMFLSSGKYFRHKIGNKPNEEPSYKANRGKTTQPWVKAIKAYLETKYEANIGQSYEADDALGYWNGESFYFGTYAFGKPEEGFKTGIHFNPNAFMESDKLMDNKPNVETILCSPDKDIISSFSGKHINPSKKIDAETWSPAWIETSLDDANLFYQKQLLMGDSSDGINPLKGIGDKKAEKILNNWKDGDVESYILSFYIEYFNGDVPKAIFEFQKAFRQLHILRTYEDFMREVGYIPEFPNIIKVSDLYPEEEKEESNIEF